nr:hypothetical protein BaRGS_033979 [Batillaria attramentaria]
MVSLSRRSLCVVFGVGVVLLAGGGIMIPVVNMLVKDKIKQTVIISNTSELYDVWSEPPLPIYMQFYMFNLSNPAEVKQGKKPFLKNDTDDGLYTVFTGKNDISNLEVTAVLEKVFMIVGGVLVVFVFGMSCRQRYTRFKQTRSESSPVENGRVNPESVSEVYKVFTMKDNNWKEMDKSKSTAEEDTLRTATELLKSGAQRKLLDFDNHLDNVKNDWRKDTIYIVEKTIASVL